MRRSALRSLVLAALLGAAWAAPAQIAVEKTPFVVTEPTFVGGALVRPGMYWIEASPLTYWRSVVQVTTRDGSRVVASVIAKVAAGPEVDRVRSASSGAFGFAAGPDGQSRLLRRWLAPGRADALEMVYPRPRPAERSVQPNDRMLARRDG